MRAGQDDQKVRQASLFCFYSRRISQAVGRSRLAGRQPSQSGPEMFDWRARPRPTLPGQPHSGAHGKREAEQIGNGVAAKGRRSKGTEGTHGARQARRGERQSTSTSGYQPRPSSFSSHPHPLSHTYSCPPPTTSTWHRQDDRHPFLPQQHRCHCAPSAAIRKRFFFHPSLLPHSHPGLCICCPHQCILEEARKRWKVLGHIGCVEPGDARAWEVRRAKEKDCLQGVLC